MALPTAFEFILIDDFSMMSVITAIEPLRVANRILGEERYAWHLLTEDGPVPRASNGLWLGADAPQGPLPPPKYTFVCAGLHTNPRNPTRLRALLNRRQQAGTVIGAVSLGTTLLARAGLLRNARVTVHWEGYAALIEEFPDLTVTKAIYEIDDAVMTSCGGLATLDLFLEILRREHDAWLVQAVSNQLQIGEVRGSGSKQHIGVFRLPVRAPQSMHKAVALIDQNLERPLRPGVLADRVGASRRTLDRRFIEHTGHSVADFYRRRRLERARILLIHSNLSILDIALSTGFQSTSYFSTAFRREFGDTPQAERRKAR